MSSINTTISSLAATNPIVGNAVAYASSQSQILSTLSGSAAASVSLQDLLTSANTRSLGNITVLPTLTGAAPSPDAAPAAASSPATANAPDFSGNSDLMIADNQSLQSSQLLSSLTGAGGTFSGSA